MPITALRRLFPAFVLAATGLLPEAAGTEGGPTVKRRVPPSAVTAAPAPAASNAPPARPALPPLPEGVTQLEFDEFFKNPVGPHGLEITPKLASLDGQKVRLLGFMVAQEQRTPGSFLFSPVPASTHESHYALADDLPASTVRVFVPTMKFQLLPHTPGPMLLTGTLSVGNREEADGRISTVRLTLDPPDRGVTAARTTAPAPAIAVTP